MTLGQLEAIHIFEDVYGALCDEHKYNTIIMEAKRNHIFKLLEDIQHSDSCKIITWVNLQDNLIPLELLWILQKTNLLQFTTYIYQNPRLIPALSEGFKDLIWLSKGDDEELYYKILNDLLAVLVNLGTHSQREISKPCQQLLHLVVKQLIDKLQGDSSLTDSPLPYLDGLCHTSAVVGFKLRSFCILHLRMLIQHNPGAVSLTEAVQCQAKYYSCSKISPIISNFYTKIFEMISAEDVIVEYNRIVTNEQYNWKWFLVSVSTMVNVGPEYAEAMKKTIDVWMSTACSIGNSQLLSVVLLCTRQCCAENNQVFGSYSTWFGSLQIRSASGFNFFIQFLSQLVPSEPGLCLKIHVNKVPTPPPHCLATLSDYVNLAKTRLADLNETSDYIGLFSEYLTTEQEGREADVAKVFAYYVQHQEVMKTVLEASVFRRQFYEKVFLPEVLKVKESDDSERGRLIRKLNSIGKVPIDMFKKWCEL